VCRIGTDFLKHLAQKHVKAKTTFLLLITCFTLIWSSLSPAQDSSSGRGWKIESWSVQTSLYTRHFDPEPDHVNDQSLLALETGFANEWIGGLAIFDNSFGQDTQFLYMARRWPLFRSDHWYAKLMGGLMHGYKDEYEDKIPFNGLGVAPAILPALGYSNGPFIGELHLGGLSVVTLTAGVKF
jgi:hypothetical protein